MYTRVGGVVRRVREAVSRSVAVDRLGAFRGLNHMVQPIISATSIRVIGAPKGTWAGAPYSDKKLKLRTLASTSGTGHVLAALEERLRAKAKRLRAGEGDVPDDECEHSYLIDGADTNAYFAPRIRCVILSPGIFRRPFADISYDEISMMSGIGFITAHELIHSLDSLLHEDFKARLAIAYKHTRHVAEAAADVLAIEALAEMYTLPEGRRDRSDTLRHTLLRFAQIFCTTDDSASMGSHPSGNDRVRSAQLFFENEAAD